MNDTPPPSDTTPGRRGPPRKRSGSRRKPAPEAAASADAGGAADRASAASEPSAVAKATDPVPLKDVDAKPARRDSRSRRGAPRGNTDAAEAVGRREGATPSAPDAELAARDMRAVSDASPVNDMAEPMADSTHGAAIEPAPASTRIDAVESTAEAPPSASEASIPRVRADARTSADAPPPGAPAKHDEAITAPIPRQASLRPGELIRVPLSVRWRDLDAFNHVNNSKYLSYLEEARLRWMLTIPGMGLDDDVAPVVAASNLNYKRPIGWPGDVVIELFVERLGNTSVTIGHRIVDASAGGVTYCDGHVVMVWIDRTSGRAAPLPQAVRAACAQR